MTFHLLFAERKRAPSVGELLLDGKPATTLYRVLERLSLMSGIVTSHRRDPNGKRLLAATIHGKIFRMAKCSRKLEASQAETAATMTTWAADLPHLNSRQMVRDLANVMLTQRAGSVTVGEKLGRLGDSFSLVNDRERKLSDLEANRVKLVKSVKEAETKYGAGASCTTLLREKLEEVQCNLEVVEIQCIRALSHELRTSFLAYLASVQAYASHLGRVAEASYDTLVALEKDERLDGRISDTSARARSSPACSQCFRELGIMAGCVHDTGYSGSMRESNAQGELHERHENNENLNGQQNGIPYGHHNANFNGALNGNFPLNYPSQSDLPRPYAPLPIQMSNEITYDFLDRDSWQGKASEGDAR